MRLCGGKRCPALKKKKKKKKKPIDLGMLGHLAKASIYVIPDKFTQLCIAAAMFMLAFHGFLRIGEITVRSGVPSEHVIQRSDLVVVPGNTILVMANHPCNLQYGMENIRKLANRSC